MYPLTTSPNDNILQNYIIDSQWGVDVDTVKIENSFIAARILHVAFYSHNHTAPRLPR